MWWDDLCRVNADISEWLPNDPIHHSSKLPIDRVRRPLPPFPPACQRRRKSARDLQHSMTSSRRCLKTSTRPSRPLAWAWNVEYRGSFLHRRFDRRHGGVVAVSGIIVPGVVISAGTGRPALTTVVVVVIASAVWHVGYGCEANVGRHLVPNIGLKVDVEDDPRLVCRRETGGGRRKEGGSMSKNKRGGL